MNHKYFFPDWTVAYSTSGLEQAIQRHQMKHTLNHILAQKNRFKKYKVNSFKYNLNFINLKFMQSAKCVLLFFFSVISSLFILLFYEIIDFVCELALRGFSL